MKPKSVSVLSKSLLTASLYMAVSAAADAADVTFGSSATFTDTQSYENGFFAAGTNYIVVTLANGANYSFSGSLSMPLAWNRLILNSGAALNVVGAVSVDVSGVSLNGGVLTTGGLYLHDSPDFGAGTDNDGKQTIPKGDSVINGSTIIASQSNASFISMAGGMGAANGWVGNWFQINGDGATIDSNGFDIGNTMNTWGGGGLTKTGTGTLSLIASNNFTGNTTINAGVLEVTSTGRLYGTDNGSSIVTVNSGGALKLNGWSWAAAGALSNLTYERERLVVNGGTIEYSGASNFNSGDPGSSGRNLTIGTGGATLRASSAPGQVWTLAANAGYGNLTNDTGLTLDGAGAGEIQKVIEGTGSVTKTGTGTWTLSGANTYSGTTTVSAGTLSLASPALDSASSVVIAAGAKLDLNFSGNAIVSSLDIDGSGPLSAGTYNSSHPTYGSYFTGTGALLVVSGASGTWNSLSDGNWEDPTNWESGTIAIGFNNTATFNKSTGVTVTLVGSQTVGNLAFDVSDYTIAGAGILTLDASGTPGIDVSTDRTATITANIAGTIGMEKAGAGTLVLTAANNISGDTLVSGGVLQLGADSASNPLFGTLENSSQLTIESGATVRAMGANAFKGYSGGSMNVTLNGGTLTLNDGVTEGGNHVLGYLTLNGGTISGLGGAFYGGFNLNDTVDVIESATISATNTNTLGANRTISVSDGKTLDWSGTIIDFNANAAPSSLTFEGTGTTVLSGANTYTGNTTINDGTLNVSSTGSLRFRPTTNGATNRVSGAFTATLSFLGTVDLDLGSADLTNGNTWTLFDLGSFSGPAPTLAPADVTSNTLGGFTETSPGSGVWERIDGANTWSFDEGTGVLSLAVAASNDYDTWGSTYGLAAGSEGGDLDNDGLTNFEEYAFGLIPNNGSSVNPIAVPFDKSTGTFSYTRRDPNLQNPALTYTVWYSTDLVNWTQDDTADQTGSGLVDGVETVQVTLTSAPTSGKFFVQVRVP